MIELFLLLVLGGGLLIGARLAYTVDEAKHRRTFAVTYPRGSTSDQVRAFTRSLSGLLLPRWRRCLGSPSVVIEAQATAAGISHYLRLPAGSTDYVLAQLRAALPGVRVEETEAAAFKPSLARELRVSNKTQALRTDDPVQSAAALLATLSPIPEGGCAVVQWVVTAAAPRPVPEALGRRGSGRVSAELVRGEREKQSEPPLHATVRIGVATHSTKQDRQLLRRILGAFHLGTSPAANFRVRWVSTEVVARQIARASAPALGWPDLVNAQELSAFAGIPMGEPYLPGLTLGASPQLPPATEIPARGRALGRATFPGAERPVAISAKDSLRHLHVIGPTGVGKSTLLLNLICGDMAAGRGIVVVDPKGDLILDVLKRVPPGRARDVILLDPTDEARPVGFNLLGGAADAPEVAADQVVSLFQGLYKAFWGPRTDDLLRASVLTLARHPGMTLAEIPLILSDEGFRRRLIANLDDYVLAGFWDWYEALTPGERSQATGPVLNKLRTFLLRKRLRNVIGQSTSTFSLTEVLTEQKVLLVSLAKGTLGEDASRLLGSALLAQLWQAVQARAALPPKQRPMVFGYVDEFQDYVGIPTSFADLLAQARGYHFGLTLAHQLFGQLPGDLKQAVLANTRSRVAFQLAHTDAATLAKEFGPEVAPDDLGALDAFEAVAQVAAQSKVSRPVSIATLPPPLPVSQAQTIRSLSRQRYGRPVAEVEAELRERAEQTPTAPIKRTRRTA
jgi:hypothetical protein